MSTTASPVCGKNESVRQVMKSWMVVINQFYIQFTCPLRVFTCLRAYLFTCLLVSFAAMEFKTKPSQKFDLPKRIARLGELAYNLWWTWQPEAARLLETRL